LLFAFHAPLFFRRERNDILRPRQWRLRLRLIRIRPFLEICDQSENAGIDFTQMRQQLLNFRLPIPEVELRHISVDAGAHGCMVSAG
jgi:hypothetical protein